MMSRKCLRNAPTTLRRTGDRSGRGNGNLEITPGPGFRLRKGFHLRIPILSFHPSIEGCRNGSSSVDLTNSAPIGSFGSMEGISTCLSCQRIIRKCERGTGQGHCVRWGGLHWREQGPPGIRWTWRAFRFRYQFQQDEPVLRRISPAPFFPGDT